MHGFGTSLGRGENSISNASSLVSGSNHMYFRLELLLRKNISRVLMSPGNKSGSYPTSEATIKSGFITSATVFNVSSSENQSSSRMEMKESIFSQLYVKPISSSSVLFLDANASLRYTSSPVGIGGSGSDAFSLRMVTFPIVVVVLLIFSRTFLSKLSFDSLLLSVKIIRKGCERNIATAARPAPLPNSNTVLLYTKPGSLMANSASLNPAVHSCAPVFPANKFFESESVISERFS